MAFAMAGASLGGCDLGQPKKYAAEVGYYQGDQLRWDLWGDFPTLEECRDAAIGRYNFYFAPEACAVVVMLVEKWQGRLREPAPIDAHG